MPAEAPEALRLRAQRILQAGEDSFAASGPPQVAEFITHRLLVAASQAVEAAAAAAQRSLSDRIRYRLLTRVVADTMCAAEPLEQQLVETLGGRGLTSPGMPGVRRPGLSACIASRRDSSACLRRA